MFNRLTLPALGLVALLGGGLGVHLGRSAIAEINPAHFGSPETRFHADLAPHRPMPAGIQLSSRENLIIPLGAGCIGCADMVASGPGYAAASARYDYPSAPNPVENFVEELPASEEPAERQASLASVERYASYPVSHEEAAASASAEAAPQPEDQREVPALD